MKDLYLLEEVIVLSNVEIVVLVPLKRFHQVVVSVLYALLHKVVLLLLLVFLLEKELAHIGEKHQFGGLLSKYLHHLCEMVIIYVNLAVVAHDYQRGDELMDDFDNDIGDDVVHKTGLVMLGDRTRVADLRVVLVDGLGADREHKDVFVDFCSCTFFLKQVPVVVV